MSDENWILQVATSFYQKAKTDVLIGYHFRNIQDFDTHIPRIASFWDLQLIGKTSRTVNPPFNVLDAHLPLNIKRGELGRWLLLLSKTIEEEFIKDQSKENLRNEWLDKLKFFEQVFLRAFRL